jgi:hypothetical protein
MLPVYLTLRRRGEGAVHRQRGRVHQLAAETAPMKRAHM